MTAKSYKEIPIWKLRQCISYDQDAGILFWLKRPEHTKYDKMINSRLAGKVALGAARGGGEYCRGKFFGVMLYAHRVAWALHYGEWPGAHIDHINGDTRDNRIQNLRIVSDIENAKNQKMSVRNRSGYTGVSFNKRRASWESYITHNKNRKSLGMYGCPTAAYFAREAANKKYGFHKNHGRKSHD